jgi:hypothetical protein
MILFRRYSTRETGSYEMISGGNIKINQRKMNDLMLASLGKE